MNTNLKVLKAGLMLWTDVSYHDTEEMEKMQSVPDLESTLCRVLGIHLSQPKKAVLLELYVQAVLFCRERSFKREQTSALISIVKSIHEANVETPLDNIGECVKYCRELLLCHSVRRPPFSINLFNSEEATCALKYIHNSYLRHYKLYKYIFAPMVKLDLSLTYTDKMEQQPQTRKDSSLSGPDVSPETQEDSIAERQDASHAPGSTSQLKTLIEQEVREQMSLVSGQLDQRMKELTLQHSSASSSSAASSQPNHKTKK